MYKVRLVPREITKAEHDHLRSLSAIFLKNGQGPAFIACVGWTIDHDWPSLKRVVEQTLNDVMPEQIDVAIKELVDAIFRAVYKNDTIVTPQELGPWLLDQVLRLPNISSLGDDSDWNLKEILKRVGLAPLSWLPGALRRRRDMEAASSYEKVQALTHRMRLSCYVTRLSASQAGDGDVIKTIADLVNLVAAGGTVQYFIPEILHDVDPEGLLVPAEIGRRFVVAIDENDAWRLARVGGVYPINSDAWRAIAKPVILRAVASVDSEKQSLFKNLTDPGPRSWAGTRGEVPKLFISEVESARLRLKSETEPELRPFWEWRLESAETELREQEELAKEQRGE